MNKEYSSNQKKQRRAFKKYRKYIGKILLWSGIAVASAFIIPYGGLFAFLKGFLGESIAMSATFFTQWGLAGAGVIGSIVNVIKANSERKKIDDSQDEEENIIDSMVNENDELKRKVETFEKTKTINKDEQYTKTYDDKEKNIRMVTNEEELNKEKKYVK